MALERFAHAVYSTAPWIAAADTMKRPLCIDQVELEA
jgi:hypothetical protein